jgi:hypothetical protein
VGKEMTDIISARQRAEAAAAVVDDLDDTRERGAANVLFDLIRDVLSLATRAETAERELARISSLEACQAQAVAVLEIELAALKGRRCRTCSFWDGDSADSYAECGFLSQTTQIQVLVGQAHSPVETAADFGCDEWDSAASWANAAHEPRESVPDA